MDVTNIASGRIQGGLIQVGTVHGDVVHVVNGESHGPNDVRVAMGWRYRNRDPDPAAAPWDFFWKAWEEPETYSIGIRNKLACPLGISDAGFVLRCSPRRGGEDLARISVPEVRFPLVVEGNGTVEWNVSSSELSGFAKKQDDQEGKKLWLGSYAVTLRGRDFEGFLHFPGKARFDRGTRLEQKLLNRKDRGASHSGDM
ncbi:hypothetical protein [Nocardiopsis eucommiae]|uniref:hypothetical protein n=1 Tax=Nocardiopsis eucommiae TaxID=2831970 RepID=UPI003D73751A